MKKSVNKQKGAALILFALVLVLGATAFLISQLDGTGVKIERDKNNALILAKAKTALIGYAIGVIGSGQRPGDLIRPDSFGVTESPSNYDGTADSGCLDASKPNGLPLINSSSINMRCLGRLPWKDLGMSINAPSENDPSGVMPWYAVSANLVDPTCLAVLNSSTLNLVYNSGPLVDCSGASLPYPWLTVHDSNGNVVSNRVAAVIFIPGAARGTQVRPVSPNLGMASQYLDTLVVPGIPAGCTAPCVPGTYNNAAMNNDFIMASEGASYAETSNFNDQLVYITIDELMAAVVNRAAGEARSVLKGYGNVNLRYPYAAPLGSAINNFISSGTSLKGMLPIDGTDQCSCSSGASCTCGYGLVNSVAHTRTSGGSYTINSGLCTISTTKCTCTGAGQCRNTSGSRTFICGAGGACTFVGSGGSTAFTYIPRSTHAKVVFPDGVGCNITAGNAVCKASGSFWLGVNVPLWFTGNFWQQYFYYQAYDGTNTMTVGNIPGVKALVVGTGAPIVSSPYAVHITPPPLAAQTRPSSNINDYLDSIENTNGDLVFEATNKTRTSNYNDQTFIVAP